MKTYNNLFNKVVNLSNLHLAEIKASYNGWLHHCNSINLQNKYLKNEQTRSKTTIK